VNVKPCARSEEWTSNDWMDKTWPLGNFRAPDGEMFRHCIIFTDYVIIQ